MSDAILVLGASGFIGSRLVETLSAQGQAVLAVATDAGAIPPRPGVRCLGQSDALADPTATLAGCRAIVHAASRTTPGGSAGRAQAELDGNLGPLLQWLEAMQARPLPLLYLSSAGALYDAEPDPGADEAATPRPRSYYGAGKLAAEAFITAWTAQFAGAATLLRPSNVYGPGQTARAGFGIVPTTFGRIVRGEPITVWGDGSTSRDYLYVDDLVDLCLRILARPMPGGASVLNAATGRSVPLVELLALIESVSGRPVARHHEPARSVDAPSIVVDAGEAWRRYGWKASTPLEQGLRSTWQWFTSTMR